MIILKYKKIFLGISLALVIASLVLVSIFKLEVGIEFTGGSIIDFSTKEKIEQSVLQERLKSVLGESYSLRTTQNGYTLKTKILNESEKQNIINTISLNNPTSIVIHKFDTVGPTLGDELRSKAIVSLILTILAIALFIAYAFRHVSKPVASWKYGLITMIALVHDIVITIGAFALLGHYAGIEVDSLFLTALLVILGYSINDTIVVFDRIRENLSDASESEKERDFDKIVGKSLSETFVRSINSSLTVLLSIAIIWYFTTGSVQNFALALFIGIFSGTYSSIFVAASLLTYSKTKE